MNNEELMTDSAELQDWMDFCNQELLMPKLDCIHNNNYIK